MGLCEHFFPGGILTAASDRPSLSSFPPPPTPLRPHAHNLPPASKFRFFLLPFSVPPSPFTASESLFDRHRKERKEKRKERKKGESHRGEITIVGGRKGRRWQLMHARRRKKYSLPTPKKIPPREIYQARFPRLFFLKKCMEERDLYSGHFLASGGIRGPSSPASRLFSPQL